MKRIIQYLVLGVALAPLILSVNAQPFVEWSWVGPTAYENGNPIIGDPLEFALHCGTTLGGPYPESALFEVQNSPALQDMVFAVMGIPGTFYCAATARSTLYGGIPSEYSNEVSFIVTPASQGFVPLPPILTLRSSILTLP